MKLHNIVTTGFMFLIVAPLAIIWFAVIGVTSLVRWIYDTVTNSELSLPVFAIVASGVGIIGFVVAEFIPLPVKWVVCGLLGALILWSICTIVDLIDERVK